jgi:hypothetical protein
MPLLPQRGARHADAAKRLADLLKYRAIAPAAAGT